jgi:hypothetical protein
MLYICYSVYLIAVMVVNVKGNMNAIPQRGWNPLNKGYLSIPEVLKLKPAVAVAVDDNGPVSASASTSSSPYVNDYNESNGTSHHYLNLLNTSVNRDEGSRERHHQAVMDEIQASQNDNASRTSIIDKLTKSRLTAGRMTRGGIWALSQTALQIVENKNKAKLN